VKGRHRETYRPEEADMKIGLSVLVDSSDEENYKVAEEIVFPFLGHFGIPYRTYDLAGGRDPEFDASGVLVAQEGLGEGYPGGRRMSCIGR